MNRVASDAMSSGPRSPLLGLRVLVVDESPEEREIYRLLLRQCGAEVSTAASKAEALDRFATLRPELLVSDVEPEVTADCDLIRAIRSLPADRGGAVPAVAITALAGGDARDALLEAGFDAQIAKPLDIESFVTLVDGLQVQIGASRALRAQIAKRRHGQAQLREQLVRRRAALESERERIQTLRARADRVWPSATAAGIALLRADGKGVDGVGLFEGLTPVERALVARKLAPVRLSAGQTLYFASDPVRDLYLPRTCVISALGIVDSGKTVETFSIARDGLVGVEAATGADVAAHWARVTVPGDALKIGAADFRALLRSCPNLGHAVFRVLHAQLVEASQTAVCIRVHDVESQLARWLLTLRDRANAKRFKLTHEAVAERLGTRRASVSVALEKLEREGLVLMRRGVVGLRDAEGLAEAACECYDVIRRASASPRPGEA